MKAVPLFLLIVLLHLSSGTEENCAKNYVKYMKTVLEGHHRKLGLVLWTHYSNKTNQSQEDLMRVVEEERQMKMSMREDLLKFDLNKITDKQTVTYIRRFLLLLGESRLPVEKFIEFQQILSKMFECLAHSNTKTFHSEMEINTLSMGSAMDQMTNVAELKETWLKIKKSVVGIKNIYPRYVELKNEAAILNGFGNADEMWLAEFEVGNMKSVLINCWKKVEPFYKQLHAYVRYMLRNKFGPIVSKRGQIPEHLVGTLNGDSWRHLAWSLEIFYQNSVLDMFLKVHLYRKEMHRLAENFCIGIGLPPLLDNFWDDSIFELPPGNKTVVSSVFITNLFRGECRLLDCVTLESLVYMPEVFRSIGTVHSEIMYSYIREDQDITNSMFSMFVAIAGNKLKFYAQSGLIPEDISDKDELIFLFLEAMQIIPLYSFNFILDLWRSDVFSGEIPPKDYNCKWWDYIHERQGLEPPVDRSSLDFDVGTKMSVVMNHKTTNSVIGFLSGYQVLQNLCLKVGQYSPGDSTKPLYKCNLYENVEIGPHLMEALKLGHEVHWTEYLRVLTGQTEINVSAFLEYFDPLYKWLVENNEKNGEYIGWESPTKICRNFD